MSAHHHIQSTPEDDADLARWDDDGAPPAQPRSSPAAWLRVGAELGDRLVALSGRQDLLVTCRPGTRSGAPAAFFPTLGEVEFDARLFAPSSPTRSIRGSWATRSGIPLPGACSSTRPRTRPTPSGHSLPEPTPVSSRPRSCWRRAVSKAPT